MRTTAAAQEPAAGASSIIGCRGGNAQPGMDSSPHDRSLSVPREAAVGSPACPRRGHPGLRRGFSPDNAPESAGKPGYSRNDVLRLQEICALTGDGLNLAGIGRVLRLQEETAGRLQAERARLRKLNRRDAR